MSLGRPASSLDRITSSRSATTSSTPSTRWARPITPPHSAVLSRSARLAETPAVILPPVRLLVAKARAPLVGELTIPPSKYHAHRALMLAALADGESFITQRTSARHVTFTVQALRALGAKV